MADAVWGSLPFDEAIEYFRDKVNFPAEDYKSISHGMHARAFTVAGVTNDDLLADFRSAIDKALAEGTSLGEFKKDFDNIVSKHGWSYKGERGWRTSIIFNTNVNMAYAAGRWKKIERTAKMFPYLLYVTRDNSSVRPEHRAWHGIILPVDHPWWKTHYPPNGYRCYCHVRQLTRRQAADMTASGKYITEAPAEEWVEKVNSRTGEVTKLRKGIDFGFDYNPGIASWGSTLHRAELKKGESGWKPMSKLTYKDIDRPKEIPLTTTKIKQIEPLKSSDETVQWLKEELGEDATFTFQQDDFSHTVMVNADVLGEHLPLDRTRYLPFLKEMLTDPFEVWASFEESKKTGKIALRYRYIKAFKLAKDKGLLCSFDANNGFMTGWTFHPVDDLRQLNKKRYGTLLYGG